MSLFKEDHKPSIMHKTPLDPVQMQKQIELSARKLFPVELAFHHLCMTNQAKAKEAKLSKRK